MSFLNRPRLETIREYCWVVFFPLSVLWAWVVSCRRRMYPNKWRYRSQLHVICVGNLHSGGSGKTPLVIELAKNFSTQSASVLCRGYQGELSRKGSEVDLHNRSGQRDYGDEAWMIAHRTSIPVFIGRDRKNLIRQIEKQNRTKIVIQDDGYQHLAVLPNTSIIAISADTDPLYSFCLPLGDLREPLCALNQADAVVLTQGNSTHGESWKLLLETQFPQIPIFSAKRQSEGLWHGDRVQSFSTTPKLVAFCGLANEEGFKKLVETNYQAEFLYAYSDHHEYTDKDIRWLVAERKRLGAHAFVTTDKDWYKIQQRFNSIGEELYSVRISYQMPNLFWDFLYNRLGGTR